MFAVHRDSFAHRVMGVDASRSAIAAKTNGTEHLEEEEVLSEAEGASAIANETLEELLAAGSQRIHVWCGRCGCCFDHSRIEVSDGFLVDDKCITKWYRGQMLSHQACSAE
jgi:hypothetical protein